MAAEVRNNLLMRSTRLARRCRFAAVIGTALISTAATAQQQTPSPIYATGNAAVTGFSGALPPIQIAPGVDPECTRPLSISTDRRYA